MVTEEEQLAQYEQELAIAQAQQANSNNSMYAPAMYGQVQKQNLVEWQLDFKAELEDIERLLRSDILVRDKDGNEVWIRNPNKERIMFNELGVNDMIRQIRMFLNKNKVLSNYGIDEIKPRIRMIAHELRILIYNNYEAYGIDNEYKMNNYSMIVLTIMSMIEDAYRRAINGEERRGLNETRIVNQNDSLMPQMYPYPNLNSNSNKGILGKLNPLNWIK